MKLKQSLTGLVLLGMVATAGAAQQTVGEARDPEAATGVTSKSVVSAQKYMVSAANPHAVAAGYRVLKEGGSAIDATIAVQMVLTLVEPQSSGIGGGAFLLHWNRVDGNLTSWDGREKAPAAATGDLFLGPDGKPMSWWEALAGGRSVGAPGVLAALANAHRKHGKLPWASLFREAIELSEKGFRVSDRLHQLIAKKTNPALGRYDATWNYFYPEGKPLQPGDLRRNPELADTFRRIATLGPRAFYKGDIAADIVATVQSARDNPGLLSAADLVAYEAIERPPVCAPYRQYRVCGMGPPTSGGLTVLQMLTLLEPFNLSQYQPLDPEAVHLYTQAARLAYADRGLYMADADFVDVPSAGLLDRSYLKQRSQLISKDKDMGKAGAGEVPVSTAFVPGTTLAQPSTSHISVVDGDGNAVSMTTSIEMAFGSTLMVRGFLLNNQLTDFSFREERDGKPVANRVQGGKRPRSSMSPVMVFDEDGRLLMVTGSPGGSRIINYVAKSLIGVLDWGLNIQQAIDLPNFTNRNGSTDLELDTAAAELKPALEALGHKVSVRELNSGLHGIVVTADGLQGGADSRREGVVRGD